MRGSHSSNSHDSHSVIAFVSKYLECRYSQLSTIISHSTWCVLVGSVGEIGQRSYSVWRRYLSALNSTTCNGHMQTSRTRHIHLFSSGNRQPPGHEMKPGADHFKLVQDAWLLNQARTRQLAAEKAVPIGILHHGRRGGHHAPKKWPFSSVVPLTGLNWMMTDAAPVAGKKVGSYYHCVNALWDIVATGQTV